MHHGQSPALTTALYDVRRLQGIVTATESIDADGPPDWRRLKPHVVAPPQRLGLLAGSFNPPTMAHLALAEAACASGLLDEVSLTISRVTVDKEVVTRATLVDRLLVLSLIVGRLNGEEGRPAVLSTSLINRGLYADQAVAVRAALPHLHQLIFIVGFDKIVQVMDHRYYEDRDAALNRLFSLASFLVAPRAGQGPADLEGLFQRPENRPYRAKVAPLPLAARYDTHSSSAARGGMDMANYLPPEATAFVAESCPYAAPQRLADGSLLDRYAMRWALLQRLLDQRSSAPADEVRRLYHALCLPEGCGTVQP